VLDGYPLKSCSLSRRSALREECVEDDSGVKKTVNGGEGRRGDVVMSHEASQGEEDLNGGGGVNGVRDLEKV
jgi:hypothetical protein